MRWYGMVDVIHNVRAFRMLRIAECVFPCVYRVFVRVLVLGIPLCGELRDKGTKNVKRKSSDGERRGLEGVTCTVLDAVGLTCVSVLFEYMTYRDIMSSFVFRS